MRTNGFSLIELLVTTAILGILASVSLANYTSFKEKASMTSVVTAFRSLSTAYQVTYNAVVDERAGVYQNSYGTGYYLIGGSSTPYFYRVGTGNGIGTAFPNKYKLMFESLVPQYTTSTNNRDIKYWIWSLSQPGRPDGSVAIGQVCSTNLQGQYYGSDFYGVGGGGQQLTKNVWGPVYMNLGCG